MNTTDKKMKKRLEFSELLIEEARPFLIEEPRVWARQIGEGVSAGEVMGQMLKARVPFAKGKLRTDALVFHEFPTSQGVVHAVQNWVGTGIKPTDFLIIIDQDIPRAAWLKEPGFLESFGQWTTSLSEEKKDDEFYDFMNEIKRGEGWKAESIQESAEWNWNMGRSTVKLPYTMQLIPLGNGQCVFLFKIIFKPGLWSQKQIKFKVDKFMTVALWMKEALGDYSFDGPSPQIEIPIPTLSFLAIPELANLISNKGIEIVWPTKSIGHATQKTSQAKSPLDRSPIKSTGASKAKKYCIACGVEIPSRAAFCPECGSDQ